MPETERDSTQDWLLPAAARPVTMLELEQRVDVALSVARSAESAAVEIGAAAFDAADQARRAAELAQRAAGGGEVAAPLPAPVPLPVSGSDVEAPPVPSGGEGPDAKLRCFSERDDRVMTRLRALDPVA
jgi:hypothetical protein